MASPHPALFDLATGRPWVGEVEDFAAVFRSAIDHRMSGLLASRTDVIEAVPEAERLHLTAIQAGMWAQNTALLDRLRDLVSLAADAGVRVGCYKGIVTESRWYDCVGERVVTDIDLLVDPRNPSNVVEFLAALDPVHPLLRDLDQIIRNRALQSVDLRYGDVRIDVHFDPVKMELLPTVDLEGFWSSLETVEIGGLTVNTPTPARTLVLTLLHTMRDRFRWLGAYADVVRISGDPSLDWDEVERFSDQQGFLTPALFALSRVETALGVSNRSVNKESSTGLLGVLWPEPRSLQGTPPQHPPPRSTLKLAMLGKGRFVEAVLAWIRRIFPPRVLMDYFYPEARGPYLVRVVATRAGKRWTALTNDD